MEHRVDTNWAFHVGLLVLLSATIGCGGGTSANVAGNVTLDGEPLTTGTVTFQPVGTGRPAYGTIDTTGHYSVKSANEKGLSPGNYQVSVVARETPRAAADSGMPQPGNSLIPLHYGDPQRSGLTCQVVAGDQEFPIALTSVTSAE